MVGEDRRLPEKYAELETLLKQVREEAAYYRKIAQEVGKRHLRETEQLSRIITKLKQTGAKLQKSEERFRETADLLPSIISEIDKNKMLTYLNKAGFEIFGFSQEELDAGINVTNLFHPDDRKKMAKRFDQIFRGEELHSTEYRMLTKNGPKIDLLTNSTPIIKNGKIVGIRSNSVDIMKIKQLQAQLLQAQKMEAIGTLAGGIAHDFNNVLMGIQGHASLALLYAESNRPNFQHIKAIEDMVGRGADLAKQLLGFARGGKYEVKLADLNEIIKKSSELFGRAKAEINIQRKYQENIRLVEVDRGQIEQVLFNLYVNAWHAMPDGGNLYIETKHVVLDDKFTRTFGVEHGNYVKISITDTGVGMDEATRQRIFDPFFTTKEMGRGTGLGLASVYGIIKNHDGIINVNSEKGKGSTFDIYLPASKKEAPISKQETITKEQRLVDGILKGTETLLLVDDEDMILDVGKVMLKEMGYNLLLAGGGKEALEIYRSHKDHINLVILDMIMPDLGGRDVYDRLKEINPDIKVLLSTGYSINGQATEILKRGCDGFIQKPFNMKELSEKIREILDNK